MYIALRLPIFDAQYGSLEIRTRGLVGFERLVVRGRTGLPGSPQRVFFRLQLLKGIAEALDNRSRLEKHAANIV